MATLDLGFRTCLHKPDCKLFMEKWSTFCFEREYKPIAMLDIAPNYRKETLDAKSRNMVVKSKRHFYYQVFQYNYHLEDIYKINTSMPERQGKPMTTAYLTRPVPIGQPYNLCISQHRYVHIGGFTEVGELKGYCALAIVGQIAIINTILGHCDSLTYGVMNGLIDYITSYLKTTTGVKYLNYLDLTNCGPGLKKFKQSVGFKSVCVNFVY
jgi:hypothetical protein